MSERDWVECPRCGEDYNQYPALSRTDNKTEICPRCGTAEAMDDYQGMLDPQDKWPV
jgi:ribosomal protein S27AE